MDNQQAQARGVLGGFFGALLGGVLGVVLGFLAPFASDPGDPKKAEAPQDGLVQLAEMATAPIVAGIVLIQAIVAAGVVGLIGAITGAAVGTSVALRGTEPPPGQLPLIGPKADPFDL
jgi:hypothetical protein